MHATRPANKVSCDLRNVGDDAGTHAQHPHLETVAVDATELEYSPFKIHSQGMHTPLTAIESALGLARLSRGTIAIAIAENNLCVSSSRTREADRRLEEEARYLAEAMPTPHQGAGAVRTVQHPDGSTYTVAVRAASPELEEACAIRAAEMLTPSSSSVPGADLRKAMGSFITGVIVAITEDPASGRPVGMTANGLVSLSLTPPLIGLSIGHNASSHAAFVQSSTFTVSILHADQSELALQLARSGPEKFDGVDLVRTASDGIRLADASAALVCRTRNTLLTGDHTLIVGEVYDAEHLGEDRPALLFLGGGKFARPEPQHAKEAVAS